MNKLIDDLRKYWSDLDQGDQRAVRLGGYAVGVMLLIGVVIVPAYQSFTRLEQQVPKMRTQLSLMQAQAIEARKLRANPASTARNESLLSVLEQSTTAHGIRPSVQNLTPRSEKTAAIRLGSVSYPALIKWLAGLSSQHQLNPAEAELNSTDTPGVVDAYFVFTE